MKIRLSLMIALVLAMTFVGFDSTVSAVNFVSISASPQSCHATCTVFFTVGSDCNECSYTWTDNGVTVGSGLFINRTYESSGTHLVSVTANDPFEGNSKTASTTVIIQ